MARMKLTRGKVQGIDACANAHGILAALAVDHRGNLLDALARSRGVDGQATAEDMHAFKSAVIKSLSPYASAILLDPEFGLEAIKDRAPGSGVMLAYEKSGYDIATSGRLPDLLPEWSVRRLVEAGADAIKILMYYNPFDQPGIIAIKQAYVERIGAECAALDVPFFLEPLVYDENAGDEKDLELAKRKPAYVARTMEEFSRTRYGVDILKVEIPVTPAFVSGTRAFSGGTSAYTRQEALAHFHEVSGAASKPFIYLSAGVTDEVFLEMLELAAEAGARYSGVLCGRATWQGGIPAYGRQGLAALQRWLGGSGVRNIQAINAVVTRTAYPWWAMYGGREKIEENGGNNLD